jgi:hypothetical protein
MSKLKGEKGKWNNGFMKKCFCFSGIIPSFQYSTIPGFRLDFDVCLPAAGRDFLI